ncbi:MAG: hypothetical protein QNJ38_03470 [Prochloraceae cyanobacterium]|nr:hypothetical protein [Prochloraceae cyanobacterium]
MNKLSLILLSSPALAWVLLMLGATNKPAQAAEVNSKTNIQKINLAPEANLPCSEQNCTGNNHLANYLKLIAKTSTEDEFSNVKKTPEGHLILEFTEEESDAAIEMFGCDCVNSINALRQIRGVAIGVEGNTIIPGPQIKPCNQSAPSIEG